MSRVATMGQALNLVNALRTVSIVEDDDRLVVRNRRSRWLPALLLFLSIDLCSLILLLPLDSQAAPALVWLVFVSGMTVLLVVLGLKLDSTYTFDRKNRLFLIRGWFSRRTISIAEIESLICEIVSYERATPLSARRFYTPKRVSWLVVKTPGDVRVHIGLYGEQDWSDLAKHIGEFAGIPVQTELKNL